ncbi:MAG: aminopeptidase P family protein [Deltaproteobacteria bacterium]|nr:aminopeptidase P family protein [Deltaproteobacteria bacterium]
MERVPTVEIESRITHLQRQLVSHKIDLALIAQNTDLFYYSGTVVDGFLAVPAQDQPILAVRRPQQRLDTEGSVWQVRNFNNFKDLHSILEKAGLSRQAVIGLELDVLPAALYLKLGEQVFPRNQIIDASTIIRRQRMIKSAYEIEQQRRAAALLDQALQMATDLLKPGMTELELDAAVVYHLRRLGHQGLARIRRWNLELFFGHVLSGISGLKAAYTDTPSGGTGVSPAFPQGAGWKRLAPGEPISIDFLACVNGYIIDQTRMYALGSLPEAAWEAFAVVEDLYRMFEAEARPGVRPGDIYNCLWEEVRVRGRQDYFMGVGQDRVRFIGHGVGLEADEFPLLSAHFPYPFEADMVVAFEPKFFLPEIGMIGQEDTGRITPTGVEWLTVSPPGIAVKAV